MSEWLSSRFTTEYAYYDKINDRIILKVFSQGCINPYWQLDEFECYYYGYTLRVDIHTPFKISETKYVPCLTELDPERYEILGII